MAVLSRELLYAADVSGGLRKTFTETWVITTDNWQDNDIAISGTYPDWLYGKEHPERRGFYVEDFHFTRDENQILVWDGRITYSDDWPDEPDPRKRAPVYSLSSIRHRFAELLDADGNPFQNLAGDFLENVPEIELPAWRLTVKKNLSINWPDWILSFNGAVNKSDIKVAGLKWPKETLKVTDLSIGEPDEEKDFRFCPMQMVLEYHPKTWAVVMLNRGLYERYVEAADLFDAAEGYAELKFRKRRILNSNGEPIDKPVFLDKNGTAIREERSGDDAAYIYSGELKTKFEPEEIVKLTFWNNTRKEYSELPIIN